MGLPPKSCSKLLISLKNLKEIVRKQAVRAVFFLVKIVIFADIELLSIIWRALLNGDVDVLVRAFSADCIK